jgi:ABC-2 type transport system permease protein
MSILKKYLVFFNINWQGLLNYRFDTTVYALTSLVTPFLGLWVWLAVQKGNPALSYNRSEIIFYFLAVAICSSFTTAWAAYFINDDIKKGNFSKFLVKPYSVLEQSLMNNIVEKIFKLSVIAVALFSFAIFFIATDQFTLPVHIGYLPLSLIALIMALLMVNFLDVSMGLAGFWMDDIDFVTGTFFTADALLSGKVVPITFLPNFLQQIGFFLPFRYTVSFPIELLLGKLTQGEIIAGFIVLFFWTIFFWNLQKFLYKKGAAKYSSYGN